MRLLSFGFLLFSLLHIQAAVVERQSMIYVRHRGAQVRYFFFSKARPSISFSLQAYRCWNVRKALSWRMENSSLDLASKTILTGCTLSALTLSVVPVNL